MYIYCTRQFGHGWDRLDREYEMKRPMGESNSTHWKVSCESLISNSEITKAMNYVLKI